MGDMTIRNIDDALLLELRTFAEQRGLDMNVLASDILRSGLRVRMGGRAAGARAILATQTRMAADDSVDLVREDRNR